MRHFYQTLSNLLRNKYAVVTLASHIAALFIIAMSVSQTQAQPQPGMPPAPRPERSTPGDALSLLASDWATASAVKGAPYCADAVAENTLLLADGNRISRKFSTRLCRDAEGRTRQEMERNGNRRVFINDVVAKQLWVLNPERRIANRVPGERFAPLLPSGSAAPQDAASAAADAALSNKMRHWARKLVGKDDVAYSGNRPAPASRDAEPVALGQVQGDAGGAAVVGVQRLPGGDTGGPQQWQQRWAARGLGVVTSLGQKEIDGLSATGRLTTWTIEAGKIGNDKALVSTSEVWTSPELRLTVQARLVDPRNGESTYKLMNVQRNATAPELFRVPDGYTVRDHGARPQADLTSPK